MRHVQRLQQQLRRNRQTNKEPAEKVWKYSPALLPP